MLPVLSSVQIGLIGLFVAISGSAFLFWVKRNRQLTRSLNVSMPKKRVGRFDAKTGKLVPLNEPNMSLAVLLFEAPEGSEEDRILAFGVSSEIIRLIATVPDIRVNARPTAINFKSGESDLREVAERLNVRYLVAGGLRQEAQKLVVDAQLTDIETDGVIWSHTYSEAPATVFDVQREIAQRIVGAVMGEVKLSETLFAESRPVHQLDAWGLINKAYYFWLTTFTPEALLEASGYLRQAIDVQPENAHARAALAMLLAQQMTTRICKDYDLCAEAAAELIEKAVKHAPDDVEVLENAGVTWQNLGDAKRAQDALRKVVDMVPLNLIARGYLALLLAFTEGDEGAEEARQIIANNFATAPKHPSAPYWQFFWAVAEQRLGNYDIAEELLHKSLFGQPGWIHSYYVLANSQCMVGNIEGAKQTISKAGQVSSHLNATLHVDNLVRICGSEDAAKPFSAGLERAGLLQ